MFKIFLTFIMCISLSSCFLTGGNSTPEQKAFGVKLLVRSSTTIGLMEGIEDSVRRIEVATTIKNHIENTVLPALNDNTSLVVGEILPLITSGLPVQYMVLIEDTYEIFKYRYGGGVKVEVGSPLTPEQVLLANAFVSGMLEGANRVILLSGV